MVAGAGRMRCGAVDVDVGASASLSLRPPPLTLPIRKMRVPDIQALLRQPARLSPCDAYIFHTDH